MNCKHPTLYVLSFENKPAPYGYCVLCKVARLTADIATLERRERSRNNRIAELEDALHALKGEWVPWKPGDALPEPGEYRVALHPHFAKRPYTVSLKVYGGDCARADAAGWRNQSVIAYFTTPLPPPYEGGNSEAKESAS